MDISQHKANIGHLFNSIAPHYDRLNHLLTLGIDRRWRRVAVQGLPRTATRALDVACGTADLTVAVARRCPTAHVTGLDLSDNMLRIAREKVAAAQLAARVSLRTGNALRLPFGDEEFDVVTCAFGVRNFSDLDAGLREMCRVTRRGGRLAVLELSIPSAPWLRALFDLYFTGVLPRIGRKVSGHPQAYGYLPASVKAFPSGAPFLGRLGAAGFTDMAMRKLTCGLCTLYTATRPT